MNNCTMCGISIPAGQKFCSMCYGDVGYGRDGYYQAWMDKQWEIQQEREHRERMEQELEMIKERPDCH